MITMDITSGMISMDIIPSQQLPAKPKKAPKFSAAKPVKPSPGRWGNSLFATLASPPSRHHDASQVERAPCDIQNHASLGLRWNDWKLGDISPKTSSPKSWGFGYLETLQSIPKTPVPRFDPPKGFDDLMSNKVPCLKQRAPPKKIIWTLT